MKRSWSLPTWSFAPRWGRWSRNWTKRSRRLLKGKVQKREIRLYLMSSFSLIILVFIHMYISSPHEELRGFISSTGTTWWTESEQSSCWNTTLRLNSWLCSTNSRSNSYSKSSTSVTENFSYLETFAAHKHNLWPLYRTQLSEVNDKMLAVQECYIAVCQEKDMLEERIRREKEEAVNSENEVFMHCVYSIRSSWTVLKSNHKHNL